MIIILFNMFTERDSFNETHLKNVIPILVIICFENVLTVVL